MHRIAPARTVFAGLALLATLALPAAAFATQPAPDHKVTICHRTDSDTNPYVVETVDIASSGHLQGGHDTEHEGPIWDPTLKAQHIEWGDIIPAYTYLDFSYPGQNMTAEGEAILENGCVAPDPEPTPEADEDPEPTPTPAPTATPEPEQQGSTPTPAPTVNVEAETGTPRITPPSTDTVTTGGPGTSNPMPILLLLGAVVALVALITPSAMVRSRPR